MNFRDVEYILASIQTGSFAKASEICSISQPSLSIQIKKVEKLLKLRVFIRDKNGVKLTEFGRLILPYFESIQQNVTQIHKLAQKQQNILNDPIKIGAIATVASYIFPYLTNVEEIDFEESTTADLMRNLLDNKIDAALLAMPVKAPQLTSLILYEEPFYLVSSKKNKMINNMDLKKIHPPVGCRLLILSDEHCMGEQTFNLCQLNKDCNNKVFKAASLETIRHMVSTSNDITLIPALAKRNNDGLKYYPLDSRFCREIGLVFNSRNPHAEKILNLYEKIKKITFIRRNNCKIL